MKIVISLLFTFLLFACKSSENPSYTTQMNDERVIIIDNSNNVVNFFTKNGLLINRVNLTTMQSQKIDLTLKFRQQIHDWNDSIFVRAELIGDKLYWYAETSGTNTREASSLYFESGGGMEILLCGYLCGWNPVYDSEEAKIISYSTSGIISNITLEEFSNIKGFGYKAKSKK